MLRLLDGEKWGVILVGWNGFDVYYGIVVCARCFAEVFLLVGIVDLYYPFLILERERHAHGCFVSTYNSYIHFLDPETHHLREYDRIKDRQRVRVVKEIDLNKQITIQISIGFGLVGSNPAVVDNFLPCLSITFRGYYYFWGD